MMWLSERLAYWISFWRLSTCHTDSGSGPAACHTCTVNTTESRRGNVVEHGFDRRIRIDAAIPIRLAVDADRQERRRQGAGGEHVLERDGHVAAVEVVHLAGPHIDRADGEARLPGIDAVEIDHLGERVTQCIDRVERRLLDADRCVEAPGQRAVGRKIPGNAR